MRRRGAVAPYPTAALSRAGRLDLRGVHFGYPGAGGTVSRNVSFTAAPGEVVAVTGPSGAGKSTLPALLMHDDVSFTRLSPRFTRRSGGRLQRIAIARALVRDTPVLVLEEPTTGLDPRAAHDLLPALRGPSAGRTTVIVSHDMSLAALADRVLVLDEGRLAESGTHTQLRARGGLYASVHAWAPLPRVRAGPRRSLTSACCTGAGRSGRRRGRGGRWRSGTR
ncbi:ABC transporter ATP-binding protein [Streptomyces sp. NBC_00448]|uniref:ABC transporter ATP-binding protein n=1 Tax=Streptomyces sp. NBC_00448 TaxID=2903652 RepID=UPI002E1C928E